MFFMILISSMIINVCAVEEMTDDTEKIDSALTDIFSKQITESEFNILTNSEYYDTSMQKVNINNKPTMKIYNYIYWSLSDKPLQTIVSEANKEKWKDYIVFDDTPLKIRVLQDEESSSVGVNEEYTTVPQFISDIQNLQEDITICNINCKLEDIVCFDGNSSYQGVIVYLKTDQGIFVKYYENYNSSALVFTEDEFSKYAIDYYNYISSYEYNYNSDGEALGGNNLTFALFLQNDYIDEEPENNFVKILIYSVISLLLIILIIFAIKKVKKNKSKQM